MRLVNLGKVLIVVIFFTFFLNGSDFRRKVYTNLGERDMPPYEAFVPHVEIKINPIPSSLQQEIKLVKYIYNPTLKIFFNDDNQLDYYEAKQLARRFKYILDKLNKAHPINTIEDSYNFLKEMSPYFSYEGFSPKIIKYDEVEIIGHVSENSRSHFHTAGFVYCNTDKKIHINDRYLNDRSIWYNNSFIYNVLIHELSHLYQLDRFQKKTCRMSDIETVAQLMTVEILSAMTTKGDTNTLQPLISVLYSFSINAAEALSKEENREEDFLKVKKELETPTEFAQWDKARRYWASYNLIMFNKLLEEYYKLPLEIIIETVNEDYPAVERDLESFPGIAYSYTSFYAGESFSQAPFILDDIKYIIENLENLSTNEW